MRNNSGLSLGTLAGAAVLALFVLAGAFLMASSSSTTGTASPQAVGVYTHHMRDGAAYQNPQPQDVTVIIMQNGQSTTIVYPSDANLQAGQTIFLRNQTSTPQSYLLINNSNPSLEDHCSAHRVAVIEAGSTSQIALAQPGSYTITLVSNPDAQATIEVGGN